MYASHICMAPAACILRCFRPACLLAMLAALIISLIATQVWAAHMAYMYMSSSQEVWPSGLSKQHACFEEHFFKACLLRSLHAAGA